MAIDVARAIAVIGMIGAHVASAPVVVWDDPSTWAGVVHGRSSILFAVVAGISVAFVTARARKASVDELRVIRLRLVGRGAAVFVVGVLLETVGVSISVILTVYGLLFVAVIPFITWSSRRLVIAAVVSTVVFPPILAVFSASGQPGGPGAVLALFGSYPVTEWIALLFVGMAVGRSRLDRRRTAASLVVVGCVLAGIGYGAGAWAGSTGSTGSTGSAGSVGSTGSAGTAGSSSDAESGAGEAGEAGDESSGPVPGQSLDFTGSLCTRGGGWTTCGPSDEFAEMSGAPGSLIGLDAATLATAVREGLVGAQPHSKGTAEIVGSGGVALVVIGLCLLVTRPLRRVLWPLAALGSCAVTAYSLHALVILVNILIGDSGGAALPPGNMYWALLAGGLLTAASLWSVAFGRGPLERVVGAVADRMAVERRERREPRESRDGAGDDDPTRAS